MNALSRKIRKIRRAKAAILQQRLQSQYAVAVLSPELEARFKAASEDALEWCRLMDELWSEIMACVPGPRPSEYIE